MTDMEFIDVSTTTTVYFLTGWEGGRFRVYAVADDVQYLEDFRDGSVNGAPLVNAYILEMEIDKAPLEKYTPKITEDTIKVPRQG